MSKLLPLTLLLPLCLTEAEAAPAPLPRPDVAVEAVFDAGTPERCRDVACFLRSPNFLIWLQSDAEAVRALPGLAGLKTMAQLVAWHKANLTVTGEGALVRVRLRGRDLRVMEAMSDKLVGRRREVLGQKDLTARKRFRLLEVRVEEQSGKGNPQALRGWDAVETEPLSVHAAPRHLRRGR
jgi:hypothetical protein